MISLEDYFVFLDDALDGMVGIVSELGDDLANRRPAIPDVNSPYVILTHCLGVMEFWGGHVIAGRRVERDRDAEFTASGPVADLVARAGRARARLADDLAAFDPAAPPRRELPPGYADDSHQAGSQGGALFHIFEELAQHRGQMEGCRDVLLAPWARLQGTTGGG